MIYDFIYQAGSSRWHVRPSSHDMHLESDVLHIVQPNFEELKSLILSSHWRTKSRLLPHAGSNRRWDTACAFFWSWIEKKLLTKMRSVYWWDLKRRQESINADRNVTRHWIPEWVLQMTETMKEIKTSRAQRLQGLDHDRIECTWSLIFERNVDT